MIDSQQASEALADINEMTRRVRQSRIYNLASLMLIMWGALVFAGYLGSFLSPRYAGYFWIVLNAAGIAGSFAISAFGYPRTGVRTFDLRALIAFLLFFEDHFHRNPRRIRQFADRRTFFSGKKSNHLIQPGFRDIHLQPNLRLRFNRAH